MTKKKVLKATPFETYTDKNGNLKRYLNLALKIQGNNENVVAKIAVEIQKMIEFHIASQKDDVKTNKNKIITKRQLESIYSLWLICC